MSSSVLQREELGHTATGNIGKVRCRTACCCVCVREREREHGLCQQIRGAWVKVEDVEDIPSWKGMKGRLAAARECRRKMLEAISVGKPRRFWIVERVVWLRCLARGAPPITWLRPSLDRTLSHVAPWVPILVTAKCSPSKW